VGGPPPAALGRALRLGVVELVAAGLPLGVQFVAPLQGEAMLIRLAAQLEAAQP
jgi:Asp-tRNA(Asn)/Glu-tRNA(Gln) amidotransferase A subunit family amidase